MKIRLNEQVQTAEVSQSNSAESASASPDQASFAGAELVGGVEPAKKKSCIFDYSYNSGDIGGRQRCGHISFNTMGKK